MFTNPVLLARAIIGPRRSRTGLLTLDFVSQSGEKAKKKIAIEMHVSGRARVQAHKMHS